MSDIALVAIDIDDTLLNSEGEISPKNIAGIQDCANQGIRIVLATARGPEKVAMYYHQLGIDDPMICNDGAQIWASPDGPVWDYRTISKTTALEIAIFADQQGWGLSTLVNAVIHWKQREGQTLGLSRPGLMIVERNVDAITDNPLRILVHEVEAIQAIHRLCQEQHADQCSIEIFYEPDGALHSLAILAPQTNKRTALEQVLAHLNISPTQAMAIGDNLNDLSMLSYVGFPVAMGNAIEQVKQVAKVIAPDNDHDGVAWALETYVLR